MAAVAPEPRQLEGEIREGDAPQRKVSMASEAMHVDANLVRTEQWLEENISILSHVNTLNKKSMALRTSRIMGIADSSDKDEAMVGQMNDYLTTVGVVSALILSVALQFNSTPLDRSGLIVDPFEVDENTLEVINILFVILIFIATIFSGVAIFLSVNLFIDLNTVMVDQEDKLWFIRNANMNMAEVLMDVSLVLLLFSIPFGMFVVYGLRVCIIASGIIALFSVGITVWYMRYHGGMRARMANSYAFQVKQLEAELSALRAGVERTNSTDAANK